MTAKSSASAAAASPEVGGEKIERIREIVFGGQIRDYNQRFDSVGRDVARLQQEVNRLHELVREQEQTLTRLLREQSESLTSQLTDLAARQSQALQELEKRQKSAVEDVRSSSTRGDEELHRLLRQLETALREEHHHAVDALTQNKTDRFSLGNLLVEMGTSLKADLPTPSSTMNDLLKQLESELG